MEIKRIVKSTDEVQDLLSASDVFMQTLYPDDSNHMTPLSDLLRENACLIGAYIDGELAGIGAVVRHKEADYGEIKRVFVPETYRGKGISKRIMNALHQHLIAEGVFTAKLETGVLQPEAIGLYKALGYEECGPFADYQPDPLSVFMIKIL